MSQEKTIGVLTSGGDAPGMNAAIRAVVRTAIEKDIRIMGIKHGYSGLINGEIEEIYSHTVSDIIQRGGTILYTARSEEFKTEEGMKKAVKNCKQAGLDGIVVIGGDGSFRGARDLCHRGVLAVGVPGTIDNDIVCTDYTIGFDTACNIATEAVDRLRDTAQSHERCSVVEVMGRKAGHLALNTGVATGAIAVILPEINYDINAIVDKMVTSQKKGKKHHIIIVAEGLEGGAVRVCNDIKEKIGMEARLTVLGHIQRGGSPSVIDRVNATRMGYRAVDLLSKGIGNRIVSIKNNMVVDFDINEGLSMEKSIDKYLYDICDIVSK